MVTGTHPEDLELFDYLEGDLPEARRVELEAHIAACAQCSERVAGARAGREAAHGAQLLELPAHRRDAILRNLPDRPREAWRHWLPARRALAVLVPLAAVAAAVVALVSTGGMGNGGDESGALAGTGEMAATEAPEAAGGDGTGQDRGSEETLSAAGPAEEVASRLRAAGFDAVALADRVEVRNATRSEVRRALQSRRDGSVRIVIVP
jgi:anti-sigma factor RsiW